MIFTFITLQTKNLIKKNSRIIKKCLQIRKKISQLSNMNQNNTIHIKTES